MGKSEKPAAQLYDLKTYISLEKSGVLHINNSKDVGLQAIAPNTMWEDILQQVKFKSEESLSPTDIKKNPPKKALAVQP